jgi:phospholipase/carboxylesterase/glyoxalase family protein
MNQGDPHAGQPVLTDGAPLDLAGAAMILLHGRGANAADILGLAQVIDRPGFAYLAPDAEGHMWYRNPFMAAAVRDEPHLASALGLVTRLIATANSAGVPPDRIALLGFSQGGCLALEFAARNPRRYGAVFGLSCGLIGDRIRAADYSGSLAGTPVFIGCSDVDPFIPLERAEQSAEIMKRLGGEVTLRTYPGAAHTIVADEIDEIRRIADKMLADASTQGVR